MMGTRLENLRLTEVVDGDTVKVEVVVWPPDGTTKEESLRLLGVDTEESAVGTKPATMAGLEATRRARQYFGCDDQGFPDNDKNVRVDVEFDTVEPLHVCLAYHRGHWGRLLCYVHLRTSNEQQQQQQDTVESNYNIYTVRQGWSPYFVKYGRSRLYHDEFCRAEAEAQANQRLIWDRTTNNTNADGSNSRNYATLLPWWHLRDSILQDYWTRGVPAGVLSLTRHYDTIVQAAQQGGADGDGGDGNTITVLCDLVKGISGTPGAGDNDDDDDNDHDGNKTPSGYLLEQVGSFATQPFWLWIPNNTDKDNASDDDVQSIVHLIKNRYAAMVGEEEQEGGGRGYVYVTGQPVLYKGSIPEIVLTSVSQLSDVPPGPKK